MNEADASLHRWSRRVAQGLDERPDYGARRRSGEGLVDEEDEDATPWYDDLFDKDPED